MYVGQSCHGHKGQICGQWTGVEQRHMTLQELIHRKIDFEPTVLRYLGTCELLYIPNAWPSDLIYSSTNIFDKIGKLGELLIVSKDCKGDLYVIWMMRTLVQ